eukprot:10054944-Prorocentrum_lima.AAC.1
MNLGKGAVGSGVPVRWFSGAACPRESIWRRYVAIAQQGLFALVRACNSACALACFGGVAVIPAG